MEKSDLSAILVKDARLLAYKVEDPNALKFISDTKLKQDEVFKLKEVDQDRLRMVVQL